MDQDWTAISLFAGIGGFEMALDRAGVRTVASVESDAMARGVLRHRFPDVALFDDVVKVSARELLDCGFNPERGIVTAGFPCQDVSLAGKRAGLAGERSGLFWHIVRLATELQPRWVLIENVPGLLTSHRGRDMATVVGAMVECGYGVSWRVLDAQHFGVPQRRRRVFVAGCLGDIARAGEVLLEPEGGTRDLAPRGATGKKAARTTQDGFGGSRGTTAERGIVQAITGSLATGGPDAQHACAGWLVPEKVSTLQAQGSDSRGHRIDAEGAAGGQLIPVPEVAGTLTSRYRKGVNTTIDDGALVVDRPGRNHLVMFSGGVGSWFTARRVLETHAEPGDQLVLIFADTKMEDEDLYRFLEQAEQQLSAMGAERGVHVKPVRLSEGRDVWEVFFDVKYIGNSRIDPCSRILKRDLIRDYIEENFDPASAVVYLGIDWTEDHRFHKAKPHWEPYTVAAPLCDPPYVDKDAMLGQLRADGIEPPRLYAMGFPHNNCGGFCVKAGHGAFKLLLQNLPERYAYHEAREEEFRQRSGKDVAILRDRSGGTVTPLTLRELRLRVESQQPVDDYDLGGCACFTPDEDTSGEVATFRKSRRAHHNEDWETWEPDDKANTLNVFDSQGDARATELVTFAVQPNARQGADLTAREIEVAPSLTATDLGKSTDRGTRVVSVTGEVAHTLTADGFDASEDGTGRGWPTVATNDVRWGVRRLTPMECERLQGFPDGHTAERWDYRRNKVVSQSDSARGHQLGNAVAVPVVEWIVRRIVANEAAT